MDVLTEEGLGLLRQALKELDQCKIDADEAEARILKILGVSHGQLLGPIKVCPECGDLGTREDGSNCPCHY